MEIERLKDENLRGREEIERLNKEFIRFQELLDVKAREIQALIYELNS